LEKILLNLSWNTVEELVVCIELGNFWPTNAEFFLSDKSLSYDPLLCLDSAIRGPNLPSLAKFSLIIGVECAWSWSSGTRPQASEINNSLKTKIKNRLPSISNSSKIQLNVRIDTNVT
jgi:hypothetical protein